ncbi:MAG: hypothetical protein MUE81_23560 [Thermoflexibacter sp.]|nr:hypothetical protein [Thermoflexibacter sp.]
MNHFNRPFKQFVRLHFSSLTLTFLLLINFVPFSCQGQNRNVKRSFSEISSDSLSSIISGKWQISCENFSGSMYIFDLDSIEIEVNSNQIYILCESKIKKISAEGVHLGLFLVKPTDLGSGGMQLNWGHFEKNTEIAEVIIHNRKSIELNWKGFYNQKNAKREWGTQTDWQQSSSVFPICLQKCP